MALMYELYLKILNIHLHTKINFLDHRFQKLDHYRAMDGQTIDVKTFLF